MKIYLKKINKLYLKPSGTLLPRHLMTHHSNAHPNLL